MKKEFGRDIPKVIAYIPFSKYEHIFASQISTYLFETKWKEKEIPRDWVYGDEIAEAKRTRSILLQSAHTKLRKV